MGGGGQHLQFFRLRSPLRVARDPAEHWLFQSIRYLDFSRRALLREAMMVAQATWGAIGPEYLERCPWPDYEAVVGEAESLLRKAGGNA